MFALIHGWLPLAVQVIAAALLAAAIGWRTRRWLLVCVPIALLAGIALVAVVRWYIEDQGLADDPAPLNLWVWIAATGVAAAVSVLGFRGLRWWRRGISALAVPVCLLCAAIALNAWVAYFPNVKSAWDRATGATPTGQIEQSELAALQSKGVTPPKGAVVRVSIPDDASGFQHRDEYVYLPPAWFDSNPPPPLPVLMMIGGEFGDPADWLQTGEAQKTIEHFAVTHDGNAPVLVFVDNSGAFTNDTECVNGPRGNAADHLTKDVIPFMISNFGVRSDPTGWGIVGWSAGGTCALTLAVTHPELFSAFVDIDGQLSPNAGSREQTIARLFGGDENAWAVFDPVTVITNHGLYRGMSAWFTVSVDTPTVYRPANTNIAIPAGRNLEQLSPEDRAGIADQLCLLASNHGIECAVVPEPGNHDFQSGASAFAAALPWLAGKVGTPGVAQIPMPGPPQTG